MKNNKLNNQVDRKPTKKEIFILLYIFIGLTFVFILFLNNFVIGILSFFLFYIGIFIQVYINIRKDNKIK